MPVCSARVSKVPQPCQGLPGPCRGEAFILCALHWNSPLEQKRKVVQYKPQQSIPCAMGGVGAILVLLEPAHGSGGLLLTACAAPERAGRRMRSHSSLSQAVSELLALVTHQ